MAEMAEMTLLQKLETSEGNEVRKIYLPNYSTVFCIANSFVYN